MNFKLFLIPYTLYLLTLSITPSNTMEINKKTVNDVYLNTWAQGRFILTDDEYNTLYGIASQEPVFGGIGVYSARVMIGEPETNSSNKKIINTPENVASPNMAGLIYPNPVTGEANIDYEIKSGEKAMLSIYGIAGNKLMEFKLDKEENHFSFSTEQLNSGIYFYQLLIDSNVFSSNKFIIVK